MRKNKNSRFHKSTIALFAAAAVLLGGSAIGSTRAALTYFSDNYYARMETPEIGVTLVENGQGVATDGKEGALLSGMTNVNLGQEYKEELAVLNSGDIDQYVRVKIYKSWTDPKGKKDTTLSPSYIDLNFTGDGWIEDESSRTTERSVWYYTEPLAAGDTTNLLSDTISIDNVLATRVTETTREEGGKLITEYEYAYDGYTFNLTAEVDAVQNHNAADAIKSAWGVDVTMSGASITGVSQGGE
jgi:hypothetical protein